MGEFTASLAHEVKQPIAAIVTEANTCVRWMTRDEPDLTEAREAAWRIVKSAKRASEIINRVRLLFKKGTSQRELVDVNEVVREMIVLLADEASRHSISIRTELAEDLPHVIGDRVQLQQVLMNLIVNGVEAMYDVDGPRELTIKSQPAENNELLLSVSDTGMGLPRHQADEIFNAFFTTKTHGPAWDFASAARLSNRMVAACGLPTTLRAAQVFVSPYPPKPRQMNDTRSRSPIVSSFMRLPLCVRPSKGQRCDELVASFLLLSTFYPQEDLRNWAPRLELSPKDSHRLPGNNDVTVKQDFSVTCLGADRATYRK